MRSSILSRKEPLGIFKQCSFATLLVALIFLSCDNNNDKIFFLYAPVFETETFLIDHNNDVFHTWSSEFQAGQSAFLQDDGSIIRMGAINDIAPDNTFVEIWAGSTTGLSFNVGGIIQRISKDNEVMWMIEYFGDKFAPHHEALVMANGNLLMPVWRAFTEEEAIEMGRNPDLLVSDGLWIDSVVEIEVLDNNEFNIVWEWFASDHLIQDYDPEKENFGSVSENPQLININYDDGSAEVPEDFMHTNGLFYIEELDQIIISVFNFSEFWIIDHSTSTLEAAGHTGGRYGRGGDLLYRWGNPSAYNMGDANVFNLSGLHDPNMVTEESYIILFSNNDENTDRDIEGGNSMLVMLEPPLLPDGSYKIGEGNVYGPAEPLLSADLGFEESLLGTVAKFPDGRFSSCDCNSGIALILDSSGNIKRTQDISENTGVDSLPSFRITPYSSNSLGVNALR